MHYRQKSTHIIEVQCDEFSHTDPTCITKAGTLSQVTELIQCRANESDDRREKVSGTME